MNPGVTLNHDVQVEIRAFLERARPIDKRLRYQMDKLLAAAAAVQVRRWHHTLFAERSKGNRFRVLQLAMYAPSQ